MINRVTLGPLRGPPAWWSYWIYYVIFLLYSSSRTKVSPSPHYIKSVTPKSPHRPPPAFTYITKKVLGASALQHNSHLNKLAGIFQNLRV